MQETIKEKVSVVMVYDRQTSQIMPVRLKWQGKEYRLAKLGLHHTVRVGRTLHHIFSVTDGTTFFRLNLDTENLQWTLEQISDGLAN